MKAYTFKSVSHQSIISLVLAVSLASVLTPAALFARTITVTNTRDSGTGSLSDAISLANLSGDSSVINFDISKRDPGYNKYTHSWCIMVSDDLPIITVPLIIDGYTQREAVTNTNQADQPDNASIKIELCGPGLTADDPLDGRRGLLLGGGSDGSQIKGLSITNFPVGVEIQSNNSCVKGCFLGVAPDGETHIPNSISVLVACGSDGACIGTASVSDRNVIGGLGFQRDPNGNTSYPCPPHPISGAVTILGSNTSVQQTTVGLTATGTAALPTPPTTPTPPVAGVAVVQTTNTTIGTPTPTPVVPTPPVTPSAAPATTPVATVTIASFPTANVVTQSTTAAVLQNVQVGTANTGLTAPSNPDATVLGGFSFAAALRLTETSLESQPSLLVTGCLVSGTTGTGWQLGQPGEAPVANVQFVNNRIGTDKTGAQPLPNGGHGVHVVNAQDTMMSGNLIQYNKMHGVFLEGSLRTTIVDSSLNFNGLDGVNVADPTDGTESPANAMLAIIGDPANQCISSCIDGTCTCYQVDACGNKICCS